MKKIFSTILALVFVFTLSPVLLAEPSPWALDEVNEARAKGLIVEEADQNYQDYITRRLFSHLVVRMVEQRIGQPVVVNIENPFEDINEDPIIKAYQLGIVKGVSATKFAPERLITRQEVAVMMMRAFRALDEIKGTSYTKNIDISGISFADEDKIADWALLDVKEAYKVDMMRGVGENRINPLGNTTVEQSILLNLRLYNVFNPSGGGGGGGGGVIPNNPPVARSPEDVPDFIVKLGKEIKIGAYQVAVDEDGDNILFSSAVLAPTSEFQNLGTVKIDSNGQIVFKAGYVAGTQKLAVKVTDGKDESQEFNIDIQVVDGSLPPKPRSENMRFITEEQNILKIHVDEIAVDGDTEFLTVENVFISTETDAKIRVLDDRRTIEFVSGDVDDKLHKDYSVTAVVKDDKTEVPINFKITAYGKDNVAPVLISLNPELVAKRGEVVTKGIEEYVFDENPLRITNIELASEVIIPGFGELIVKEDIIPTVNDRLEFKAGNPTTPGELSQDYKITVTDGVFELEFVLKCTLKDDSSVEDESSVEL